jgi:hypothetical protein
VYPGVHDRTVTVTHPTSGDVTRFAVERDDDGVTVTAAPGVPFRARLAGGQAVAARDGRVRLGR